MVAEPPGTEGREEFFLFLGALNTHEPQPMLFFIVSLLQENLKYCGLAKERD